MVVQDTGLPDDNQNHVFNVYLVYDEKPKLMVLKSLASLLKRRKKYKRREKLNKRNYMNQIKSLNNQFV